MRDDNTPWDDWIDEIAIVKQSGPNVPRLSGVGIRRVLYFGTAPGNHLPAVSATKGGFLRINTREHFIDLQSYISPFPPQ